MVHKALDEKFGTVLAFDEPMNFSSGPIQNFSREEHFLRQKEEWKHFKLNGKTIVHFGLRAPN